MNGGKETAAEAPRTKMAWQELFSRLKFLAGRGRDYNIIPLRRSAPDLMGEACRSREHGVISQ